MQRKNNDGRQNAHQPRRQNGERAVLYALQIDACSPTAPIALLSNVMRTKRRRKYYEAARKKESDHVDHHGRRMSEAPPHEPSRQENLDGDGRKAAEAGLVGIDARMDVDGHGWIVFRMDGKTAWP